MVLLVAGFVELEVFATVADGVFNCVYSPTSLKPHRHTTDCFLVVSKNHILYCFIHQRSTLRFLEHKHESVNVLVEKVRSGSFGIKLVSPPRSLCVFPVVVVSVESREAHLSSLVVEAERRAADLAAQAQKDGLSLEACHKDKQLRAWEWRSKLYKRMRTGFQHARESPLWRSRFHLFIFIYIYSLSRSFCPNQLIYED